MPTEKVALKDRRELADKLRNVAHGYTLGRRSREHDYRAIRTMREAAAVIDPNGEKTC